MAVTFHNVTQADLSDADKSGAEAVKRKVEELLGERRDLRGRWRSNTAALKDALAAGRLFGVQIDLPPDIDQEPPNQSQPRIRVADKARHLFESPSDATVRDGVVAQLKAAGKAGTKAALIREHIEKVTGRSLHYKTVGMTLYRLAEKGQVRREGHRWFYVPPPTFLGDAGK